jgi:hypothetical protein
MFKYQLEVVSLHLWVELAYFDKVTVQWGQELIIKIWIRLKLFVKHEF